jgi:hypothetical protein
VSVVILCRLRAYSKKKSLTFSAICAAGQCAISGGAGRTHGGRAALRAPLLCELAEHRVRAGLADLAQAPEDAELVVRHAHVRLQ